MRYITVLPMLLILSSVLTGGQASAALHDTPVKDNALKVLTEKCNVCHRRQNPGKVFTDNNMNNLAPAIYKQVFVKKRMPRGNTIKLTAADQKALMDWLRIQSVVDDEH